MTSIRFLLLACSCLSAPLAVAQDAMPSFGHARARERAELGVLPTPLEIAVADIANYHHHNLPLPRAGETVQLDLRFLHGSARPGDEVVLQVGITTAPSTDRSDLPPLNLALVVDCSGSMAAAGKLDQVKRGLRAFAGKLRPEDRVTLVTYADEAAVAAASRQLGAGRWLDDAIDALQPGGSTNLHAGLLLGLREVAAHAGRRGSNRVVLLTDGIANRGVTDPQRILDDATRYTTDGIDVSTIGLGQDLQVDLLDRLARGSGGLFHFVADAVDVEKVFVDEAAALLAAVARRPELALSLPGDLRLLDAFGHEVRNGPGGECRIALPDLNRGATAVVICRCEVDRRARHGDRLDVHAVLRAERAERADRGEDRAGRDACEARTVVAAADGVLRVDDGGARGAADREVEKNHAIAVLAQGMHDMALQAEQRRWADADRALRRALDFVRERFGHGDDADVQAVVAIAEGHQRTLRRYVDRFRDL